jgi:hypothetical protein
MGNINIEDTNLSPAMKFLWSDDYKEKYIQTMTSTHYQDKLKKFISLNYNDPNIATHELTNIMKEVAESCIPLINTSAEAQQKATKVDIENHKILRVHKRDFNKACRKFKENRHNHDRRKELIISRRKYRKIKYYIQNYKKENKLHKLAEIQSKDPKLFWKCIKKITSKKIAQNPNITPQDWITYFKNLLNIKSTNNKYSDYIDNSLEVIEKQNSDGPLDHCFDIKELESVFKCIKSGKSAGPDLVTNEMIKFGGNTLHLAVIHLFNIILKSGQYPESWKCSIITPIHKALDINDPNNYRGIAVADCISKIFCKILNDSIIDYLKAHNFWKPNQNGFMENSRTEDNVMILNTVYQKYVKHKKKKLYIAFVDFRKFFDCINRNSLLYKLQKCGIMGNTYNLIKSAYNGNKYGIKTKQGITENFTSTRV